MRCFAMLCMLSISISTVCAAETTDTYARTGKAKMLKGNYAGAIADYTEALKLDPKNALALVNRGCTYKLLGKKQDAIASYMQAASLFEKQKGRAVAARDAKARAAELK